MTVIEEIAAERRRQIEVEGWTPAEDDAKWDSGQLAKAAACYAMGSNQVRVQYRGGVFGGREANDWTYPWNPAWPWDERRWKPKDPRRNLIRAAALIVAEIERLDRESPALRGGA